MPAEHRLSAGAAGLYGKHPGFGDFISAGLAEAWPAFADWAQASLGLWRDAAGPDWQARFDAAPVVGFWIGPALIGAGQALRGVMAPSRDRSGRRFPLALAQAGGTPPVLDTAQDFHRAAGQALAALLAADGFEPREAAQALDLPAPGTPAPDWPGFWAGNPALPPQQLLGQLAVADHAHATAARSYWWFGEGEAGPSGVLCCQGWPTPAELGWLIAHGAAREVEA
ncbi:type VI secretion-associated protein, BMA_A0400 family [Paracoccus aminovorans]|uniref:Type VI secretion-associated protein, BMA_A0400 family n=1 Tax=Paracoccus aminovorans TaxID=34004 RepID=A0A1I3A7S8_9RHOB|nr:type VI secretion system-associated protein TagF [Paracoccus aminovorans]SFH46173.1 type VI secretion-associated protein, BMA_A0400 family [Paracoccus aminovorans]